MRSYNKKTRLGHTPPDVMLCVAKEVKLKNKSIRSVVKEFNILDRTLIRFCLEVTDAEIHGSNSQSTSVVVFNSTRKAG